MPGFDEACSLAFEEGFKEHVGMHLVLNEGVPLTDGIRKEARFCNREGELCMSRESPVVSLSYREKNALATEIRGQIKKCRERRIPLSHVDSHHHVHTEWGIAKVLIPIIREEGIPFVRIARNLVKNREIMKRVYKGFFNATLGRNALRASDYFGSVDEYLLFMDGRTKAERIIEIMIHPHYKGDTLYVTDSMEAANYKNVMRVHLLSEGTMSFRDLHSRRLK